VELALPRSDHDHISKIKERLTPRNFIGIEYARRLLKDGQNKGWL
jgi:hypothetical protein